MAAGWKSSRITPLLGLAFLISAMTPALPSACLARRAATKSRRSWRASASARTAASGRLFSAAAISWRLVAMMVSMGVYSQSFLPPVSKTTARVLSQTQVNVPFLVKRKPNPEVARAR